MFPTEWLKHGLILKKYYLVKSTTIAGFSYFFNHLTILFTGRLKRHPIPGTIGMQKVALMPYLACTNQQ